MDAHLSAAHAPDERTLTISVDIRPREFTAALRMAMAQHGRWPWLRDPVVWLSGAGLLFVLLRRGPPQLSSFAMPALVVALVVVGVSRLMPYLVAASLSRSASRSRIRLTLGPDGIHVDRGNGESWLSWMNVRILETSQLLLWYTDEEFCYLPKRLLSPTDDAVVRRWSAHGSGRAIPSR